MQGLGKVKVVFDVEKIKTECHAFARNITSVIYIVQVSPSPITFSLLSRSLPPPLSPTS